MAEVRVTKQGRKAVFIVDHKDIKPLKDYEALGLFIWVNADGMPEIVQLADEADE